MKSYFNKEMYYNLKYYLKLFISDNLLLYSYIFVNILINFFFIKFSFTFFKLH